MAFGYLLWEGNLSTRIFRKGFNHRTLNFGGGLVKIRIVLWEPDLHST